jgi:regulator of nonsense transcripts 1
MARSVASPSLHWPVATSTQILLVSLLPKASKKSKARLVLETIFSNPSVTVYTFKFDYLAAALYLDHDICLAAGKHLLSVTTKKQLDGLMVTLGGEINLNKPNVIDLFRNEESLTNEPKTTALQAWAAYQAATMPHTCELVLQLPVINTLIMDQAVLILIYYANGRFLISFE